MERKEIMIVSWLLKRLEKEGIISRNIADITLSKYKKKYIQDLYESEDNDYRKAA